MSLTSLLAQRGSPLREWFERELPNLKPVQTALKAAGPATIIPTDAEGHPWSMVGMALDYRIRYLYEITPPEQFVAARGAAKSFRQEAYGRLSRALLRFLSVNDPRGGVLPEAEEQTLARYCYLLSVYEVCYRNPMAANPLHSVSDRASVPTLLGVIPSQLAVEDICALIDGFVGTQSSLLGRPIAANPKFAESVRLGGADADLIVDHCLIDIKTVRAARLDRPAAYQVIGYALADSDDEYGISEVAIYLARQPALLRWSLDGLIDEASNGESDLATLRQEFSRQLDLMHGRLRLVPSDQPRSELAHATSQAAFPRVKCWCCGKFEDDTFVGTGSHAICFSCFATRDEGAALWESGVSEAIARLPISVLERAGARNTMLAELWRKGVVPEPRHWSALAKLAGISWETLECEAHDRRNAERE